MRVSKPGVASAASRPHLKRLTSRSFSVGISAAGLSLEQLHAMLYGEGERFVSALLVPRRPVLEAWQRERGLALDYGELLGHPEVASRVQHAVDRVNSALSGPERIKRFVLLERDLSVEADELTPTMKIRRAVVTERYRDRLELLYREPSPLS